MTKSKQIPLWGSVLAILFVFLIPLCSPQEGAFSFLDSAAWGRPNQEDEEEKKFKRAFDDEQMKYLRQQGNTATNRGWRFGPDEVAGHYVSVTKLVLLTILFWLWVATTSWTNNDTQRMIDLYRYRWNRIQLYIFPSVFLISLLIPSFWGCFPVAFLAWLVPVIVYVLHRNKTALDADKVLTPNHLGFLSKKMLFMDTGPKKAVYEQGPDIQFTGWGNGVSKEAQNGRGIVARNTPGYPILQKLVYHAIKFGAAQLSIAAAPGQCRFLLTIDGVNHSWQDLFRFNKKQDTWGPEDAHHVVETIKTLCGNALNVPHPQTGEFFAKYDQKKKMVGICNTQTRQGTETAQIQLQLKELQFKTLDDLGMVPSRAEEFRKMINAEKGLVIFSAPAGQGLRTFTNTAFSAADRFVRDFATVEDVHRPYMEIENVPVNTYDSRKGETPMKVLPDLFFREIRVILVRDMVNLETFKGCCEDIPNGRLVITTDRGYSAANTIMRLLKTGIDQKLLADSLLYVINQRLLRRLCPKCKEAFVPTPQIRQRYRIPPTVQTLYKKRLPPNPNADQKTEYEPCRHCREIGYLGRAAIYDTILINDEIRHIIATNPNEKLLAEAAVKAQNRGFYYDALQLFYNGTTSIEEISRVMKG